MTAVTEAVTVRLPYAAAIAAGHKLVENRGRATAHRGPIAIHAGASWSKTGARDPRILRWRWGSDGSRWPWQMNAADFGPMFRHVVAVADLVDCHQVVGAHGYNWCCWPWGDSHYNGDPQKLAWHLVLDNVRVLPIPVLAAGTLRVPWTMPADVADLVNSQLETIAG